MNGSLESARTEAQRRANLFGHSYYIWKNIKGEHIIRRANEMDNPPQEWDLVEIVKAETR